jgi:thiamine-monophosphate kinase
LSEITIGETGEFDLIARITEILPRTAEVIIGPGDDTALVATRSGSVLATIDVLVEGVHFRRDWSSATDVGRKAAAASLADIAAMGGVATALLVGFAAPGDLPVEWALECTAGLTAEATKVGASIVGGDVVASSVVTVCVTALGDLQGRSPVLRSGAHAGDVLAVAGRLGWSAAGLAVLSGGSCSPAELIDAHQVPDPPYSAGPAAADAGATAMIDVSDGLIADARHLAEASGVDIMIDSAGWIIPESMSAAASALGVDPREWMLTGGEDHALLATFPAGVVVPAGFRVIGSVMASDGPGVIVDGVRRRGLGGHVHFSVE